jgi:EAL domain-containing protein (putative c-di-GMP-specific phosphodiesterase class I)
MQDLEAPIASSELRNLLATGYRGSSPNGVINRALQAVRAHLGLQVAYVSEFVGNDSVFRVVDAPGLEHLAKAGDVHSLDDIYCRHILEGRLPELIADTANEPVAMALPITAAVPIGAHVSVPIRLASGDIYGMFCCLGPQADPSLNARDLGMMRAFADLAAFEIEREMNSTRIAGEHRAQVEDAIAGERLHILYQPIFSLSSGTPAGFEALARFPVEPIRSPDRWFAQAAATGLGSELELLAIRLALRGLPDLPAGSYLSVNAGPAVAASHELLDTLAPYDLDRIVLEITEHERIVDVEALLRQLAPLRARGLRVAVDDAGSGYSGLQQVVQLRPDLIKLDRFLIDGIQNDPGRRALAAALMMFARETHSKLVAEGVEKDEELAVLQALGVDLIQGYLLGRPQTLASISAVSQLSTPATATRRSAPFRRSA